MGNYCLELLQEVVTLQKKYLIYLHLKLRSSPFINYTILKGECYSFTEQNNFRSDELDWNK